jgi:hypothetical protein
MQAFEILAAAATPLAAAQRGAGKGGLGGHRERRGRSLGGHQGRRVPWQGSLAWFVGV